MFIIWCSLQVAILMQILSRSLVPKEMLKLGVFGGKYMCDCRDEFPASWFKDAKLALLHKDSALNCYQVDASLPLREWGKKRLDLPL